MKLLPLIFALLFFVLSTTAQDRIILKKGESKEVLAEQLTDNIFYYRMTDYPDGPILQMSINRIKQIEYANGVIDYLSSQSPRMQRPFSASLTALVVSSDYEIYILPRFDCGYFISQKIEVSGNLVADFYSGLLLSLGGKYHFINNNSNKRLSPYAGFMLGIESSEGLMTEIPLGLNYACFNGLNLSAGLSFIFDYYISDERITAYHEATLLNVSVGWRF